MADDFEDREDDDVIAPPEEDIEEEYETIDPAPRIQRRRTDVFNDPWYGLYGPLLTRNGWSTFPQERDERRRPCTFDGDPILWGLYQNAPPPAELVDAWAGGLSLENVAIVLGRASGMTIALDIDVTDVDISLAIQEIAFEILGETKFQRIGTMPKVALIYRVPSFDQLPPYRKLALSLDGGRTASEHAIEVLGQSRALTGFGLHHKTNREFGWSTGVSPANHRPEDVPIVTLDMLDAFADAVQERVLPFHRNGAVAQEGPAIEFDKIEGLVLPRVQASAKGTSWSENESGLVMDGRDAYLSRLCFEAARANPARIQEVEGVEIIAAMLAEQFLTRTVADGRWSEGRVVSEARIKLRRLAAKLKEGSIRPSVQSGRLVNRQTFDAIEDKPGDLSLSFVKRMGTISKKGGQKLDISYWQRSEEDRVRTMEARRLQPDRTEIEKDISRKLVEALEAWLKHVYEVMPGDPTEVHILKAPTGAGKTSRTIFELAADPRTTGWEPPEERGVPGPFLFLLPTYHNIDEIRTRATMLNLDGSLDDAELSKQAEALGIVTAENAEVMLGELRRNARDAGLRTMVYRGKKAAGCKMSDKLDVLMAAGVNSAGLCLSQKMVKGNDKPEEVYCPHYHECPAIQQRKEIKDCHVVFAPHAFFSMNIPDDLKNVRGVIADESIFHLFVHTTTFDLQTLSRPRRPPRLSKREREAKYDPTELLAEREKAGAEAFEALRKGECPATRLMHHSETNNGITRTGMDLVKSAIRVCSSAISSDQVVTPEMSLDEIVTLCSKPTGHQISEELRFWKIVAERIETSGYGRAHAALTGYNASNPVSGITAKGDREYRIQCLTNPDAGGNATKQVRISWRSRPNWEAIPLLLLDASAQPDIIRKIFHGTDRTIVEVDLDAPLNVKTIAVIDKTYSNASVTAKGGAWLERIEAGRMMRRLQGVMSMASTVFGHGRVVAGASVLVRRAINTGWRKPTNIDWTHFGAMRGLDFAKNHVCAVSIGRMEVPVQSIDGLVAALTYDDDVPEKPFDLLGNGMGPTGEALRLPLENRTMPLRDGRDVQIGVPTYPGKWARMIQAQYREEELRQFLGRLRPVYRSGDAPVWIAVSKVIPDGVVVDELITLTDLLKGHATKPAKAYEAGRLTNGVFHPDLLHAAMPYDKASVDDWARELRVLGMDLATGKPNPKLRSAWGVTPVKFRRYSTKTEEYAFVRTSLPEPERQIGIAFMRWLGETIQLLEIGDPILPLVKGVSRPDDWVEMDLGTLEERERDEIRMSTDALRTMLEDMPGNAFGISVDGGDVTLPVGAPVHFPLAENVPEAERVSAGVVTHDEIAAMLATKVMLERHAGQKSSYREEFDDYDENLKILMLTATNDDYVDPVSYGSSHENDGVRLASTLPPLESVGDSEYDEVTGLPWDALTA